MGKILHSWRMGRSRWLRLLRLTRTWDLLEEQTLACGMRCQILASLTFGYSTTTLSYMRTQQQCYCHAARSATKAGCVAPGSCDLMIPAKSRRAAALDTNGAARGGTLS